MKIINTLIKAKILLKDTDVLIPITSIKYLEKQNDYYFPVFIDGLNDTNLKYPNVVVKLEDIQN